MADAARSRLEAWFASRGWSPHDFQRTTWDAFRAGRSGLVHVPTGAGKTWAAVGGPLEELIDEGGAGRGARVLYVTPLRAVSRDIAGSIEEAVADLLPDATVGLRTGDTGPRERARQRRTLPTVLVTTPESLHLLLMTKDAPRSLRDVRAVVVDEWHELLSTKRGSLLELALTHLRTLAPRVRTWALSATLANVAAAARAAVGTAVDPVVVHARLPRPLEIRTLVPASIDAFPWAGHLGLGMVDALVDELESGASTLIFTNTRHQAETWYRALITARPEWFAEVDLHHGSLDRRERERVEGRLAAGRTRAVVATSSLDLGVDFAPVERVVQIGSPKGIARLLQRAGRSAHRPGATARLVFVPTHAFELVELAAVRAALAAGEVEARVPLPAPLDVLSQHVVSRAVGAPVDPDVLYDEVRTAASYAGLDRGTFDTVLALVERGGTTLEAYPDFHRVDRDDDGRLTVTKRRIATLQRLNVGTICADGSLRIRYANGHTLGRAEEHFLAQLGPGDRFRFAGRTLELRRLHDGVAHVRRAKDDPRAPSPRWYGGRMPLSTRLADRVRTILDERATSREMQAVAPVLEAQRRVSHLPNGDELLVETLATREGRHLFVHAFEGRLANEGLGVLLAHRIAARVPVTLGIGVNDYSIEFLGPDDFDFVAVLDRALFAVEDLDADLAAALSAGDLARRRFREVARVSGLVPQNDLRGGKTWRQLQNAAGTLFDVFQRYDPDHVLLEQTRREVLEEHFERSRMERALRRMASARWVVRELERPSPLCFPLVVDRIRSRVSSESLADRVERLKRRWARVA